MPRTRLYYKRHHFHDSDATPTEREASTDIVSNQDSRPDHSIAHSDNADTNADTAVTYPLVQNRMFDVPEIIRSIAEFLNKSSLAASCRVSRTWATHCTPLLWKHIVDKHWRDGSFCSMVRSQSHYVQSMKCEDWTDYEELMLCEFPRLRYIAFHGSKEPLAIKERFLDKVSSSLISLVLSSVSFSLGSDTARAIQRLGNLTTLKLLNMSLEETHLEDILLQCDNIEFLSLSRINILDHDIEITSSSTRIPVTRIKFLALKEVPLSLAYLSSFIASCPDLLELSLARNEYLKITTELIRIMKESCPRLYAIDVGSCKQLGRETFSAIFTTLTELTIINLSGTTIADEELLLLAQSCKALARLDIQYCTSITSEGLHQFLSHSGPSLKHLEASGVTIDPKTFDRRPWMCTNLQILFMHIGLVGSVPPPAPLVSSKPSKMTSNNKMTDIERTSSAPSVVTLGIDCPALFAASDLVEITGNDRKRSQTRDTGGRDIESPLEYSSQDSASPTDTGLSTDGHSFSISNDDQDDDYDSDEEEDKEDLEMSHALHPVQNISNVQYLGLMGCGPKLTYSAPSQLIRGFRSVKRLHVLGLYQAFKKEDLEWLVESLPELCRIDAEKYNISDELFTWFHEVYPHVHIYRQEC
ncbi:hypothetical protein BGX28_009682 [Mortierella sp. GBA30]|nr:hypothetical protein BGX28_009682 [Mortierella sp. GBA30]